MKRIYRRADFAVQIIILHCWLITTAAKPSVAFSFYFITGAWFLVSLIIHLAVSSKKYKNTYKVFFAIVCGIITIFCLGLALPILMFTELYILLFTSPVLAVAYTSSCFVELRYFNKRPISYLK